MNFSINIIAILISISIYTSSSAINNSFTINNQPINPVCVWVLDQYADAGGNKEDNNSDNLLPYFQSDKQLIDSINLTACQQAHTKGSYQQQGGPCSYCNITYTFPWGAKDNVDPKLRVGVYAYGYIGETNSGLDVLHIYDFGGGTGQFDRILVLKRQNIQRIRKGGWTGHDSINEHTSLRLIASFEGGDRNSGSFESIKIVGDTITGTRYNQKNNATAGGDNPDEKFSFTLPQ